MQLRILAVGLPTLALAACVGRTIIGDGPDELVGDRGIEAGEGGDAGPEPLSCAPGGPGTTNCGTSSESCCTSPEVTGGTFFRTYENSGSGPTGEADPATISGLRLDKYLVTVGRFRQFVEAWNGGAGYVPPAGSGKHTHLNGGLGLANSADPGTYETGWLAADDANIAPTDTNLSCSNTGEPPVAYDTWTPSAGTQENLPMSCVNWQESYAFCIWDGGFLPSEAEWEYAAAGGSEQREYPWGSADPGTSSEYAIYNCEYPSGSDSGDCTGVANYAPVGTPTRGAGLWQQLDLVGEVFVWTIDLFAPYASPCTDCAYVSNATSRVFRGMSLSGGLNVLVVPNTRNLSLPSQRLPTLGFRCARTP
jgi:formylglycine-generating enzyme